MKGIVLAAALVAASAVAPTVATAAAGEWTIKRGTWESTGQPFMQAILDEETWGLVVSCRSPGHREISFVTRTVLGGDAERQLSTRFDQDSWVRQNWWHGEKAALLDKAPAVAFIARLKRANRLAVMAVTATGMRVDREGPVGDADVALREFDAECAKLPPSSLTAGAPADPSTVGGWEIRVDTRSNGQRLAQAILNLKTWGLVVSCTAPGERDVTVMPGPTLGGNAFRTLATRLDDDPWIQQNWWHSGDAALLPSGQAATFIARLEHAKRLAVRATTQAGAPVSREGSLGEPAAALAQLNATCAKLSPG